MAVTFTPKSKVSFTPSQENDDMVSVLSAIDPEVAAKKTTSNIFALELGLDDNAVTAGYGEIVKNVYGTKLAPTEVQRRMEEDGLLANPKSEDRDMQTFAFAAVTNTDPPADLVKRTNRKNLINQTAGVFSNIRKQEEQLFEIRPFVPPTTLPDEQETEFRKQYSVLATELGLSQNPDDREHFYDYRALFKETGTLAVGPQKHFPSKHKLIGHPNLIVDGKDTRTGETARPSLAETNKFANKKPFADAIAEKPSDPSIVSTPIFEDEDLLDVGSYMNILNEATTQEQVQEIRIARKGLIADLYHEATRKQQESIIAEGAKDFTTGSKARDVVLEGGKGLYSSLLTIEKGVMSTSVAMGMDWNQPNAADVDEKLSAIGMTRSEAAGKIGFVARAVSEAIPSFAYNMTVGKTGIFITEFGNSYQDVIDNGDSQAKATATATVVATINTQIESMQIDQIFSLAGAGAGAKQKIKKMVKDRAWKAFLKSGAKFTGQSIKTAINEGIEGALQEGVSITVPAIITGVYPKNEDGTIDWVQVGSQIGQSFVGEGLGGLFLGSGGALYNARNKQNYKMAVAGQLITHEGMTESEALTTATNILERMVAQDGIPKDIYREELAKVKPADNRHKASAHIVQKARGIGDDQYRDIAEEVTGKRSLTEMNYEEAERFIGALKDAEVEAVEVEEGQEAAPEATADEIHTEVVAQRDNPERPPAVEPSPVQPVTAPEVAPDAGVELETEVAPTDIAPKAVEAKPEAVEGEVKKVFHGGTVEKGKLPTVTESDLSDIRGVFFTEDADTAKFFGEREGREGAVQEFEIDIKNPATGEIAKQIEDGLRAEGVKEPQLFDAVTDELLERGFDSVIRESGTGDEIIVLKDELISQPTPTTKPAEAVEGEVAIVEQSKEVAEECPRCTNATLKALGVETDADVVHGIGVTDALSKAGVRGNTLVPGDDLPANLTLKNFLDTHPTGSYYIMTANHAMALVDGELTDTANGTGRRKVVGVVEVIQIKKGIDDAVTGKKADTEGRADIEAQAQTQTEGLLKDELRGLDTGEGRSPVGIAQPTPTTKPAEAAVTFETEALPEPLARGAKDNRRSLIQNRIRLGKPVPAKLLQEFKGEAFADDLLAQTSITEQEIEPTPPETIKQIERMSYKELQTEAKSLGLKSNQKKDILINRISALRGVSGAQKFQGGWIDNVPFKNSKQLEQQIDDLLDDTPQPTIAKKAKSQEPPLTLKALKKTRSSEALKTAATDLVTGIDKALGVMSTRVKNISPQLFKDIRNRVVNPGKLLTAERNLKAEPFVVGVNEKMNEQDRVNFEIAQWQGNQSEVNKLITKYGLVQEYADYRIMLDEVYHEGNSVGMDIDYQAAYFPSAVKDFDALMKEIGRREEYAPIVEAMKTAESRKGRPLNEDERLRLVDTLLRGFRISGLTLSKPGFAKERSLIRDDIDLIKFYHGFEESTARYVGSMTENVQERKFFGKTTQELVNLRANISRTQTSIAKIENGLSKARNPEATLAKAKLRLSKLETELSLKDDNLLENSVANHVLDLVEQGLLRFDQQNELKGILEGLFKVKGSNKFIHTARSLEFAGSLAQVPAVITQYGEIVLSILAAPGTTLPAFVRSNLRRSKISLKDLGVAHIGQEWVDADLDSTVTALLKPFQFADNVGKETFVNSTVEKWRKIAESNPDRARKEIAKWYPDAGIDAVLESLKSGKVDNNVKGFALNQLADVQPISKFEVPELFAKAGNLRVFYMYKTFVLKRLDILRSKGYNEIKAGVKAGSTRQIASGLAKLIWLTFMFSLADSSADAVKDFIRGKPIDSMPNYMMDNLLQMILISKFSVLKSKREGLGSLFKNNISLPVSNINAAGRDVNTLLDPESERGSELVRRIPWIGELYYWYMGEGARKLDEGVFDD